MAYAKKKAKSSGKKKKKKPSRPKRSALGVKRRGKSPRKSRIGAVPTPPEEDPPPLG